jgi:hypothetical protein
VLAGRERVQLRDVEMTLPVPLLSEMIGGRIAHRLGLVAEGDVSVRSASLDWIPPTSVNGNLDVQWRRARFNLPGSAPIDLGDVTARLNANGERLAGADRQPGRRARHPRRPDDAARQERIGLAAAHAATQRTIRCCSARSRRSAPRRVAGGE